MLQPASGRPRTRDRGSNLTEFREFSDGEVIAGTRYRVLRLVGVGGMGSVYEVEHVELGKRFVLKALLRELSRRDDLVQRLRNEWRALARLQHANIVNVTDAGTSGSGVPFYVMERLDGDTLAGLLRQKRRLHVLEAVNIASSVLDALSAAHEIGIIHRDVKPANVFIVQGGGVKLLDFGIAKIANATGVVTARGLAVGTPRYMSPEQTRGERLDGRSDIYASALTLYEMIAGVGPFDDVRDSNELLVAHMTREAPPLSSKVPGVSPELERLLTRMLAKDCRQRPAHAREAAESLRSFALRQRAVPATDVTTARAGYEAQTRTADQHRKRLPSSIQDSITRPEGAARRQLAHEADRSDDALTQRIELGSQITQVTLSASTGDSFSVSTVPNTTFVSPPSFDGSTTLPMSTRPARAQSSAPLPSPAAVERPERTELLGDFPQMALPEPPATRTQVPLPEHARPASITPPPVVDTGRSDTEPRNTRRAVRWIALSGVGLALALALGFGLRGPSSPSESANAPVAASLSPASLADARALPVERGAVESKTQPAAEIAPALVAAAAGSTSPGGSRDAGPTAALTSSVPARNLRMIVEGKRVAVPSMMRRSVSPGLVTGPPVRSSTGHPAGPKLPGSGL